MEIKVLWDTGEKTWEPLNVMKMDDPVSCGSICQGKESTRPTILERGQQVCQEPKEIPYRYCRQICIARKEMEQYTSEVSRFLET